MDDIRAKALALAFCITLIVALAAWLIYLAGGFSIVYVEAQF